MKPGLFEPEDVVRAAACSSHITGTVEGYVQFPGRCAAVKGVQVGDIQRRSDNREVLTASSSDLGEAGRIGVERDVVSADSAGDVHRLIAVRARDVGQGHGCGGAGHAIQREVKRIGRAHRARRP